MRSKQQSYFDAIQIGNIVSVKASLDQHPDLIGARNQQGLSGVLLAMYHGHSEIAAEIVRRGAPLDIFEASAAGVAERIKALLKDRPDLVNAVSVDGFQPLGLAAFFGQAEVVEILLRHNAAVNSPSRNAMKVAPLHSAAASGRLEIVNTLLNHGADPNAVQEGGFTPLHAAAQNGQTEMIELLLANGAKLEPISSKGETPLRLAQEAGKTAAVSLLNNKGAVE